MVKIRLTRTGRKNHPSYRVVATDSHNKRDGKVIEYLGHYSPLSKEFACEKERVEYWLSNGAQLSNTVARLMVKQGTLAKSYLPVKQKFVKQPGRKATERNEKHAAAVAEQSKPAKESPAAEVVEIEAATETPETVKSE